VVALNASAARITGVSRVRPDNAAAVELPLRRLAELGHTSVAFLSAPRRLMADPDRLRHFRRVSGMLGLRATVLYSPLTMGDVQQATRGVLAGQGDGLRGAPTAVITNSDYTAHAVYKAARELALRIGPEVSVVGHDDLATSELLDPPLATIWLNRREMGRALMLRLLGRVPPEDYVAPVRLIERASLRAPEPRLAQLPPPPPAALRSR
jgi:LacI family transcriptional regulator